MYLVYAVNEYHIAVAYYLYSTGFHFQLSIRLSFGKLLQSYPFACKFFFRRSNIPQGQTRSSISLRVLTFTFIISNILSSLHHTICYVLTNYTSDYSIRRQYTHHRSRSAKITHEERFWACLSNLRLTSSPTAPASPRRCRARKSRRCIARESSNA